MPLTVSDHNDYKLESTVKPVTISNSELKNPTQNKICGKILLVEDHPLAAIAVEAILEPFNCDIERAENGTQAVKMAQEGSYDLILMDIGLPDFSGIEATRRIRALSKLICKGVPIVALTGHGNNAEIREEALEAGMQDVLTKPAKPHDMQVVLKKYVFHDVNKQNELSIDESTQFSLALENKQVIDWAACVEQCGGDTEFTKKNVKCTS